MAATTTTEIVALDMELVEALGDAAYKLGLASCALDELQMDARLTDEGINGTDAATRWLLQGWTADLLLDATTITRYVLEIRGRVFGGATAEELELLEAVGGAH